MSGPTVEIPVLPATAQVLQVQLGAALYGLRLRWSGADEGGWLLDISDISGNPLTCGIPLVTGTDLLDPFAYLGIPGQLYCYTDGNWPATPSFDSLGTTSHLVFKPS